MLKEIIKKLEKYIDTDDFEYEADKCIEQLENMNTGIESVKELFELIERHPLSDFGGPGSIVYYLEQFFGKGYEGLLEESINRKPTVVTILMLNRLINGNDDADKYLSLMKTVSERTDTENEIKELANEFLDYQRSK